MIRLFKRDLAKEMGGWVDKDLISRDQAQSICHEYGVDYGAGADHSLGYRLLVSMGYLFIGVAVIILIGANWEDLPRELRLGGLIGLTLATQLWALRCYHRGKESSAIGLFFLGNLFYGASIILVAQIYHLGEHIPNEVFWWALGCLPFGVLLRNSWLTLFSCVLAMVWFFMELSWGSFPLLMPVFILAAVYVLIKGKTSALLFMAVVGSIGLWVEALLARLWGSGLRDFDLHAEHLFVSVALFIFAYAFSLWLHSRESEKAKDYGVMLSLWALRFGLVLMLVLSFSAPWDELISAEWNHLPSMAGIVAALMGVALWIGWKTRKLQVLVPIVIFSTLSMASVIYPVYYDSAVYFQVVYNLILVAFAIALIVRGINHGVSHYFFLGVATILLVALMRYVDLIGEYIGGAVLFMVLAALLLGAARYWKVQQFKEMKL
ncbi:MAG: DUF2157 domain-containing protein [Verrucomicrobiales bacterium]|nr:DUF2157 domain-containing protein [Verrucomicrobiales bacterium]